MKPKVEIEKRGGRWVVMFTIGFQTFRLSYGGTKSEATWMASILKKAFKNIN